jgi:hypothetical protein
MTIIMLKILAASMCGVVEKDKASLPVSILAGKRKGNQQSETLVNYRNMFCEIFNTFIKSAGYQRLLPAKKALIQQFIDDQYINEYSSRDVLHGMFRLFPNEPHILYLYGGSFKKENLNTAEQYLRKSLAVSEGIDAFALVELAHVLRIQGKRTLNSAIAKEKREESLVIYQRALAAINCDASFALKGLRAEAKRAMKLVREALGINKRVQFKNVDPEV